MSALDAFVIFSVGVLAGVLLVVAADVLGDWLNRRKAARSAGEGTR